MRHEAVNRNNVCAVTEVDFEGLQRPLQHRIGATVWGGEWLGDAALMNVDKVGSQPGCWAVGRDPEETGGGLVGIHRGVLLFVTANTAGCAYGTCWNCPGRRMLAPYTISAEEIFESSFGVALKLRRT